MVHGRNGITGTETRLMRCGALKARKKVDEREALCHKAHVGQGGTEDGSSADCTLHTLHTLHTAHTVHTAHSTHCQQDARAGEKGKVLQSAPRCSKVLQGAARYCKVLQRTQKALQGAAR